MVKLAHAFNLLKPKKILVAGDFILDRYIFGKSKRISPEAPVPVVHVEREEERAGGAGNVVLNLLALGMSVRAFGCVGKDSAGIALEMLLQKEQVDTSTLFQDAFFHTSHKTRVIASNQQIVRFDDELRGKISKGCEENILTHIPEALVGIDLVAISDYAKGFLTQSILQKLITTAKKRNIPVVTDPKGKDFTKYAGSTIIKPNLGETIAAGGHEDLDTAAAKIFQAITFDVLMVTRSEAGISLFFPNGTRQDYPVAKQQEVRDVTGAGDSVLAMLSASLANGLSLADAAELSNIAGAIAIERVGCAKVSLSDVARRLIAVHAESKVFSSEHMSTLEQALQGHRFTLLEVDGNGVGLTPALFRAIQTLAALPHELVVCCLEPCDEEFVSMIAALQDVDYVLVHNAKSASFSTTKPVQRFCFTRLELSEV